MQDALVVAWKEWREQGRQRSTLLSAAILLGIFGVLFPVQEGPAYLASPTALLGFMFLPFAVILAIVADAFAGERERHTLESLLATRLPDRAILLGKLGAAVAYGWGLVVLQSIVALVAVNVAPHGGGLVLYRPFVLAGGLLVGLLVAILVSALGVLVSLRASTVRQAQQILALSLAVVGGASFGGAALLPAAWREPVIRFVATAGEWRLLLAGAGLLAAVAALLLALCVARFRRAKLILD